MKTKFLLLISTITFFISIVLAFHLITTSTGTSGYSTNETIETIYNISVNNTNAGQLANITQVNITIPSSFTFTADSNTTSASASTFTNTTTELSWSNTTGYIINGSETIYFWFNASASTPGNYNITVETVNITGTYSSNLSVEVNDTTNPTAFIGTNPVDTYNSTSSNVTFDIKCNDTYSVNDLVLYGNWSGLGWHANQTNSSANNDSYWNVTVPGIADGTYKWSAYCNDSAGNSDWDASNRTLTVDTTSSTATFGTNPINTKNSTSPNITFDYKCSDALSSIDTMQLWGNWSGSWVVNDTNTSVANNTFVNISLTGLSDGSYKWAVFCNDSLGNSAWTSINRTFVVDTTNPTASASCTATDINAGGTITCSCSGTDATSGVSTSTASSTPDTSQMSGAQTYTCSVTDYAGNSASSTATYTVSGGGSSSSGGGGGETTFWTKGTHVVTNEQFKNSFTKEIQAKQRLKVKINNQNHHVGITKLTATTATIEVSSDPQTATLSIGDERKFEVTNDTYYDILVKLNSITNNNANITIKSINELITEETQEEQKTAEEKSTTTKQKEIKEAEKSRIYDWTIGIIVIIAIVVALIAFSKKKKKK